MVGAPEEILEVPVAIWSAGRMRMPVAGGGYFRLLPRQVIERGLRSIAASGRPAVVYCHPYEFNSDELADYPGIPWQLRLSQGTGRGQFTNRIRTLLTKFSFGRLTDVLSAWGLT